MIFDEIVLHDFGIYAGKQSIRLTPPSADKPISVFYGLNGCGKTTILEALQIVLFGQQAPFLQNQKYTDYITQRINKKSLHGQASLRLDFHRHDGGKIVRYRIYRSWKGTPAGTKENLEVIKDGHNNKSLATRWKQHVEEIISARLAHFFFFDGEKIEEYASQEGSRQLIKTGLYNLLGLDLIGKSEQDLMVLKRRKLSEGLDAVDDSRIKMESDQKQRELEKIDEQKTRLISERAAMQTHEVDPLQREFDNISEERRHHGGEIWDQRDQIKVSLLDARKEKNANNALIREALSGVLPLLLVSKHFDALEQHKKISLGNRMNGLRQEIMDELNKKTVNFLTENGTDQKIINKLKGHFKEYREIFSSDEFPFSPFLESDELDNFNKLSLGDELREVFDWFEQCINLSGNIDEKINGLMADEASLPEAMDMKKLTEQQTRIESNLLKAKASLERLDAEIETIRKKREQANNELEGLQRRVIEANIENDKMQNYIGRLDSASSILRQFSKQVLSKKITQIEQAITESYNLLLRKENFLNRISVDPEKMDVILNTADGQVLSNSQLSAGERQLLSISILWGLAKSSPKPFPMAIDTPFGRLDSTHRKKLASNYFPHASRQLLLFSTDEEIVGEYFKIIKPYIGWVYTLDYDSIRQCTEVKKNYVHS